MSLPCHDNNTDTLNPPPQRQQQLDTPALQMPAVSLEEYRPYAPSDGDNPPQGREQNSHSQCLAQPKPQAANMYNLPTVDSGNVVDSTGAQLTMSSMQPRQTHHKVTPSLSMLNSPKMVQKYGGIPADNALEATGLAMTAPITMPAEHRRPTALTNNSDSKSNSLLIAHQLESTSTGTTPASIVSSSPYQQQQHSSATMVTLNTCHPLPHIVSPQVAAHSMYLHSLANHNGGRIPTPAQQQQQHVPSFGASNVAPEHLMMSPTAALLALPSPCAPATPIQVTPAILAKIVDTDLRQAHERPFRFKMLPPPPLFGSFMMLWETNASDQPSPGATSEGSDSRGRSTTRAQQQQQHQNIAPEDTRSIGGAARPTERRNVETTLPASIHASSEPGPLTRNVGSRSGADEGDLAGNNALQWKASSTITESVNGGNRDEVRHSIPDRLAMLSHYHRILERWWVFMVTFENKAEVRQQLGDLRACPSFLDAQRVFSATAPAAIASQGRGCRAPLADAINDVEINVLTGGNVSAISPTRGTTADPLLEKEAVLRTWSTLVCHWWEETKRRRRPRRSRPGAPNLENLSAPKNSDDANGRAGGIETHEAASLASVNSDELPINQEAQLTNSPLSRDHDTLLHFDFTCASPLNSTTGSFPV